MSTQLKTRVLTNGKSTWRITRFSDELFIAKNGFNKQHTFRCDAEVINFEDFLFSKGFAIREANRYTDSIKRIAVAAWQPMPPYRGVFPLVLLLFIMTYSFDTLYQEYILQIQEFHPDRQPSVNDFINDTMANVCLFMENDMDFDDKLEFLFAYIQDNQLLPK